VRTSRALIGTAVLSLGLALPAFAGAADPVKPAAGDPVKPDLGAGPHRDSTPRTSGEGESPRQPAAAPAVVPKPDSGGASTGSSASSPASPEDERSARDREEDERRATESKDKMKKRPGYKHEVPAPHASRL
jgi:hypothetical protein